MGYLRMNSTDYGLDLHLGTSTLVTIETNTARNCTALLTAFDIRVCSINFVPLAVGPHIIEIDFKFIIQASSHLKNTHITTVIWIIEIMYVQ